MKTFENALFNSIPTKGTLATIGEPETWKGTPGFNEGKEVTYVRVAMRLESDNDYFKELKERTEAYNDMIKTTLPDSLEEFGVGDEFSNSMFYVIFAFKSEDVNVPLYSRKIWVTCECPQFQESDLCHDYRIPTMGFHRLDGYSSRSFWETCWKEPLHKDLLCKHVFLAARILLEKGF